LTFALECYIASETAVGKELIYLKSAFVGLFAVVACFVALRLFLFASSVIGLGIDIPRWRFIVPIFWSGALFAFGIGFFAALWWLKKRDRRRPFANK
jgi:hypothetical protein